VIVSRLLKGNVDGAHAVPAWLIPGVATLDIAVAGGTLPMEWAHEVNLFAAGVGAVVALVFFTMIFSRLVHKEPLAAGMLPSLMILIAPFEVGFLAYVNIVQRVDMFAALLFYFGLFLFVVVAIKIFRPSIPFAASWWAISFPMAALANAALKYAAVANTSVLNGIAGIILAILTIAIAVLFVRTLHILANGKLLAG
jgi:tellurite resistance protein